MKVLLTLVLLCASVAQAQTQTREMRLAPPSGTLSEEFPWSPLNRMLEGPRNMKELSDGRVLFQDVRKVWVLDFSTKNAAELTTLKAAGGSLLSLAGDSSLYSVTRSWIFLNGTSIVGSLPESNPLVAMWKSQALLTAADNRGNVYMFMRLPEMRDSTSVHRFDRVSGDRSIVANLFIERSRRGVLCPLGEQFATAPDGWVAVVRANPYRVDWQSPNGQWTRGDPIAYERVRITESEKRVYMEWAKPDRDRMGTQNEAEFEWPEFVCPFHVGYSPIATPDGKLLVYRVPTRGPIVTRYDVINRQGKLEAQLVMNANQAILGFGRKSVYVYNTDGKSQTISRHPWP
jgi:hypothetical protein